MIQHPTFIETVREMFIISPTKEEFDEMAKEVLSKAKEQVLNDEYQPKTLTLEMMQNDFKNLNSNNNE